MRSKTKKIIALGLVIATISLSLYVFFSEYLYPAPWPQKGAFIIYSGQLGTASNFTLNLQVLGVNKTHAETRLTIEMAQPQLSATVLNSTEWHKIGEPSSHNLSRSFTTYLFIDGRVTGVTAMQYGYVMCVRGQCVGTNIVFFVSNVTHIPVKATLEVPGLEINNAEVEMSITKTNLPGFV